MNSLVEVPLAATFQASIPLSGVKENKTSKMFVWCLSLFCKNGRSFYEVRGFGTHADREDLSHKEERKITQSQSKSKIYFHYSPQHITSRQNKTIDSVLWITSNYNYRQSSFHPLPMPQLYKDIISLWIMFSTNILLRPGSAVFFYHTVVIGGWLGRMPFCQIGRFTGLLFI